MRSLRINMLLFIMIMFLIAIFTLCPLSLQKVPFMMDGKEVLIQDISYVKSDSFHIDYDAVNTTEDTLYVLASKWIMDGISSKFKEYVLWPFGPFGNTITYSPVYPKALPLRYYVIDGHIKYNYRMEEFIKLEPHQKQSIHIVFSSRISRSMKWCLNAYKFRIQMWYLHSDEWSEYKKFAGYEANRFVIHRSSVPVMIRIAEEDEYESTGDIDENRPYISFFPLNPSMVGEFILK